MFLQYAFDGLGDSSLWAGRVRQSLKLGVSRAGPEPPQRVPTVKTLWFSGFHSCWCGLRMHSLCYLFHRVHGSIVRATYEPLPGHGALVGPTGLVLLDLQGDMPTADSSLE